MVEGAENHPLPSPLNIPQEPSAREAFFAQFDFNDTVRYQKPPYLFEINGKGFSPLGGIQALSGQKKNGKSIFASVLLAAVLCNGKETGRMAERFPGVRLRQSTAGTLDHDCPTALYVDTEQERENTSVVLERAKWLAEIDKYSHDDRLQALWLREMPEGYDVPKLRWQAIKYKIETMHPDLCIIDGIRDIVHDFNDLAESSSIINELMNIASKNRMCIWCTLHMNPRPSNDDESKMRGHLGTELGNKVSDTFVMKKSRDKSSGAVTFTLAQIDARGEDVDDMKIELNHDGDGSIENLGYPKMVAAPSAAAKDAPKTDNVEALRSWIKKALEIYDWPMSRQDFKKNVLKEIGHVTNKDQQGRDLDACLDNGLMQESTLKKNGYYMIEPSESDIPF